MHATGSTRYMTDSASKTTAGSSGLTFRKHGGPPMTGRWPCFALAMLCCLLVLATSARVMARGGCAQPKEDKTSAGVWSRLPPAEQERICEEAARARNRAKK